MSGKGGAVEEPVVSGVWGVGVAAGADVWSVRVKKGENSVCGCISDVESGEIYLKVAGMRGE